MLHCLSPLMARYGRADCSPSCPLLEVYLPRQPAIARQFMTHSVIPQ